MKNYEVKVDLRKNATYSDGTEFPVRMVVCADSLQQAKEFGWELFVAETKTIMRREMCKVEASRA
jgi:hypothetical protein